MFGGHAELTLSSGLVVSTGKYFVQLGDHRLDLPYPSAGYGGSELVVAPDERHVAMFVYSGQSEVGLELFRIDVPSRTVEHVFHRPYVAGVGDAPAWSPDGRWLARLATQGPFERASGAWLEEVLDPEADAAELVVADFGELFLLELVEGRPTARSPVAIGARVRRNADFDALATWDLYGTISFTPAGKLAISPKWAGGVELELPPAEPVTLAPHDDADDGRG
jgi:hypothetical protein